MPNSKNTLRIICLAAITCFLVSCRKDSFDEVDLLGKWRWWSIHHGNETVFQFKSNDTLIIYYANEAWDVGYLYYPDNTIRFELRDSTFTDRLQIEAFTLDSIEIIGFSISSIPEEPNTTILSRIDD